MPITERVYPMNDSPNKSQIEQMYQVSAGRDPSFMRDADFTESGFGIDRTAWVKDGFVKMNVPTEKLRQRVGGLWARLSPEQRVYFWMTYLNSAGMYLGNITAAIEVELGIELPLAANFMRDIQRKIAQTIE